MSHPAFDVWLDEERQIVRQRMYREPNLEDFKQLIEETNNCVRGLRNPSAVRILIDGRWQGRMKKPIRTLAIATLRDKPVQRMAVINTSRVARVVVRFIHAATGIDYMRVFPDEDHAVAWLLS